MFGGCLRWIAGSPGVFAGTIAWKIINAIGMATSPFAAGGQMGATRDVAHDQPDSNLWGGVREKPSRSRQHVGKAAGLAAVRFVNTAAIRVGDGLAGVGDASVGALGATRSGLSKVGDATVGLTTNTINATVGVVNLSVNATMDGAGLLAGGVGTSRGCMPTSAPRCEDPSSVVSPFGAKHRQVARSRRQAGHARARARLERLEQLVTIRSGRARGW